jgi:hypothetical protein
MISSNLSAGTISVQGNGVQTHFLNKPDFKYTFSASPDNADRFEKFVRNNNPANIVAPEYQAEQEKQLDEFKKKLTTRTVIGGLLGVAIPTVIAITSSKGSKLARSLLGILGSVVCGAAGVLGTAYLTYRNAAPEIVKQPMIRRAEANSIAKAMGMNDKVEFVGQK